MNDNNFKGEIKKAEKLILVDFQMENYPPYDLIKPILEKLTQEFKEKNRFF